MFSIQVIKKMALHKSKVGLILMVDLNALNFLV